MPPDSPDQLELFPLPKLEVVAMLRSRGSKVSAEARAPRTRAAYDLDWRVFRAWCASLEREALPASGDTLCLFVAEHLDVWSVATLQRRLAGVGWKHRKAGQVDPTKLVEVRELMRGVARSSRRPSGAKAAVTVDELRSMVEWARDEASPRGERDVALLLVGFAGGFRRSELSALDLADVLIVPLDGALLQVRRSKTDQLGLGRAVAIARGGGADTCPVRALEVWLEARGRGPGPLFLGIDRWGHVLRERLGGWSISDMVRRAALACGLAPGRYSAHSLRAGLVTAAHDAGASDSAIMLTTGHRRVETLARYMRSGRPFAQAAARGLL
jgi:integrase